MISRPIPRFTWDQLDALVREAEMESKPPNTFTAREFSERKGLHIRTARDKLRSLVTMGKLTEIRVGRNVYYALSHEATRFRKEGNVPGRSRKR